jgi:hypothetical protein
LDPLQVLTDPASWVASWLWPAIFGKAAVGTPDWPADFFAKVFNFSGLDAVQCTAPGGGNCTSFSIWSALQTTGYLVLAMALMLRLVRNMVDPNRPGRVDAARYLLVDILVRAVLGVAAINLSYVVLAGLMHSSIAIGGVLFETIMSVTTANAAGQAGLRNAIAGILSPANLPIPLILETLALLYLTVLLLASRIAIIFATAVAPLIVPLYAFSSNNTLLLWWLRMIGQGLLVPLLMGTLFPVAVIVTQAANSVPDGSIALIFGTITAVVSMWFVGHSIRQLLRHLFPAGLGSWREMVPW